MLCEEAFLVCDGSWTFSKTVFDTTEPLAAAAAFVDMASGLELTVTGTKDGNAAALADGTVVVLTSEFGEKEEATVTSGKIKVDLSYGTYQAAAGDYEGTLTVVKDALPTELKLTYIGSENVELELTVTGTKDGNAAALADGTVVVLTSESGEKVEATVASGKIKVDLSYGTYQAAAGDYEGTLAVVKDALPTELQLTFTGAEGDPKDPEPPATGTGDGTTTTPADETEGGTGNSEPPVTD